MGRNSFFRFKEFEIRQDACAMKITTDACLFGAWCAQQLHSRAPKNVLDIGTGTGVLSLMLAQATTAHIAAVEMDASAAVQAAGNFANSSFAHQLQVVHADVQEMTAGCYDAIISNPPFYEQQLQSPVLNRNAAMHSTALTLQNLLMSVDKLLHQSGQLFLLMPYYRKDELVTALESFHLFPVRIELVRPVARKLPFRIMVMAERKRSALQEGELIIRSSDGSYTPEFIHLLQPYYLHL